MNHVYRLKRSGRTQQLQPVPETARAAGKGSRTGKTLAQTVTATLASVALGGMASLAHAQQAPPAMTPPAANQLPQGGVVTRGSAHINTSTTAAGNALMSVNQSSNRAVIDWASFNVGSQAKVRFNQPSSSAVTLNNILGNNASQIYGQISANGQVFLSNPNGVYFSPTAQVNVGGLVATTGKANADEFMAGKISFNRAGSAGSVVNEGQLTSAAGGYIALLAPEVRNQGVVVAQAGTVALASGEAITLSFNNTGTGLAGITTTPQAIAALVENRSVVLAEGGQIILSAHALTTLQGSVVKNSGQLSATSLQDKGGKIVLMADSIELTGTSRIEANGPMGGGTVLVGGDWQGSGDTRQAVQVTMAQGASIEANATQNGDGGKVVLWSDVHNASSVTQVDGRIEAKGSGNGNGGQVETSGHTLKVGDHTRVNTTSSQGAAGQWLLDPNDFTVAASGGDITGTALSANLASGNVTIASTSGATVSTTNGSIFINDTLAWSANTLTLNAQNNITVSKALTLTGTAGLAVQYGQNALASAATGLFTVNAPINIANTGNFSSQFGSDGAVTNYTIVSSLGVAADATTAPASPSLQGMAASANASTSFVLGSDIDATATSGWNSNAGFTPIGNATTAFSGKFNGLGHTMTRLSINAGTSDYLGLFGKTTSSVANLVLSTSSITGRSYVGALAGYGADFYNIRILGGSVTGTNYVGGMAGYASANVDTVNTSAAVTGRDSATSAAQYIGGLLGAGAGAFNNVTGSGAVTVSNTDTTLATGASAALSIHSVGGLVGQLAPTASMTLANNINTGSVTVTTATVTAAGTAATTAYSITDVGGLIGTLGGSATSTAANWRVTLADSSTSGNVSVASTTAASMSTHTSFIAKYTGGLIGRVDYAGIAGMSFGGNLTLTNLSSSGSVSGYSGVGGLVGVSNLAGSTGGSNVFSNLSATGNVTGFGDTGLNYLAASAITFSTLGLGGLFGANIGTKVGLLQNSHYTGDIFSKGGGFIGGVIGTGTGQIDNAYATGTIALPVTSFAVGTTGTTTYAVNAIGGLVGYLGGSYTAALAGITGGSYSNVNITIGSTVPGQTSSVTASNVGGLVGMLVERNTARVFVDSAYAMGNITVTSPGAVGGYNSGKIGGLIGSSDSTNSVTGQASVAAGSPSTLNVTTANISGTSLLIGASVTGPGILPGTYITARLSGTGGTGTYTLNQAQPTLTGIAFNAFSAPYVANSYATGNISAANSNYVGGLGGNLYATYNSHASGNVSGVTYVGGLVGSGMTVFNSYALGNVTATGSSVGGILGGNSAPANGTQSIVSSYWAGQRVIGAGSTGGLVGNMYGGIYNSYVTGDAQVSGSSYVGGLVGKTQGDIANSYSTANVTGTSAGVGGLVGTIGQTSTLQTLSSSWAIGAVSGTTDVGGLVGVSFATVKDSYANGAVTSTGNSTTGGTGGLIGSNLAGGSVSNSFATGAVTTTSISTTGNYAGGLIGFNQSSGSVNNSYATGSVSVSGLASAGGLIGYTAIPVAPTTALMGLLSISGTTLTVPSNSATVGGVLGVGTSITGTGVAAGTTITSFVIGTGGGTGGLGTYNLSGASQTVTSATLTGNNPTGSSTASISGNTMTLGGTVTGYFVPGTVITSANSGIPAGTYITGVTSTSNALTNGFGGSGSVYTLSNSVSSFTSGPVTGTNVALSTYATVPVAGLLVVGAGSVGGGFAVGMTLAGPGIPAGTTITGYSTQTVGSGASAKAVAGYTLSNNTFAPITSPFAVVGTLASPNISNVYATGNVTSNTAYSSATYSYLGGLIGQVASTVPASIAGAYSSGAVTVPVTAKVTSAVTNNTVVNFTTANMTGGGVTVGATVSGTGIPAGTTVVSISGFNYTLSQAVNVTANQVISVTPSASLGRVKMGGVIGYVGTGSNTGISGAGSAVAPAFSAMYFNSTANSGNYAVGNDAVGGAVALGTGATGLSSSDLRTASAMPGLTFEPTTTTLGAAATGRASYGNYWVIVDADGTYNKDINGVTPVGATTPMLASEYTLKLTSAHQLQLMGLRPAAAYAQQNSITFGANDVWSSTGFVPVGTAGTPFSGSFIGTALPNGSQTVCPIVSGGCTITGLTINSTQTAPVGLFGTVNASGAISGVRLLNATVSGVGSVGAVVGSNAGSLVFSSSSGAVSSSAASGSYGAGGIVGENTGTVDRVFSTATVTAVGGGNSLLAGGVIGDNQAGGTLSNAYAASTGTISASGFAGGLAGANTGTISNGYAAGRVLGASDVAGGWLATITPGTLSNSFWDLATTQQSGPVAVPAGGGGSMGGMGGPGGSLAGTLNNNAGMGTLDMQTLANYTTSVPGVNAGVDPGWNFSTIWNPPVAGSLYPALRDFLIPITVTANAVSKVYDGAAYSGPVSLSYSLPNVTLAGTAAYTSAAASYINVGSYHSLMPTGLYSNQYNVTFASGTLTITPKPLTFTASSAPKLYDGTTALDPSNITINGLVGTQTLTITNVNAVSSQVSANASNYINSISLADGGNGGLLANYSAPSTLTRANAPVTIVAKSVTVSGVTASDKTYDGTTTASVSGGVLSGVLAADSALVSVSGTGVFASPNAANGITVSTALSGLASGNYLLTQPAGLTATINPKSVTVTDTARTTTYDGVSNYGTLASGTAFTTSALVGSDAVTLVTQTASGTGVTASGVAQAGSFTVTPSAAVMGTGLVSNYDFSYVGSTHTVDKANATVTAKSGVLTYNGADQTVSGLIATGLVGGESVSVLTGVSASRTERNAGTYATTASGTDSNYNLAFVDGSMVINKAALTATGNSAQVTYNGANQSVNGFTVSGLKGNDTEAVLTGISASGVTGFNVGSYVNTMTVVDQTNYTVTGVNGSLLINAAPITAIQGALQGSVSKVYDSTNAATLSSSHYLLTGWLGSDMATVTKTAGTFDTANAGSGKTVTVSLTPSDYQANGSTNLSNYALPTSVSGAVGQITKASVTPTITASDKVYDTTTVANGAVALTGVYSADASAASAVAAGYSFANANVGMGKTVTASGITLGAGLTDNYVLSSNTATGTASITPAPLTVTARNAAKFVTQTDTANFGGYAVTGLLDSETPASAGITAGVSLSRSNAAVNLADVYPGVLVPSGAAVIGNYAVSYVPGTFTIVPAGQLLVETTSTNTTYGTSSLNPIASVSYLALNGININSLTLSSQSVVNGATVYTYSDGADGTARFSIAPTGTTTSVGGRVNVGSYGLVAGNFSKTTGNLLSNTATVTGNLTVQPLAITVAATPSSTTYNSTTQTQAHTSGVLGGDAVTVSGAVRQRNAGSYTSALSATGADVGNYSITYDNSNFTVNPAVLTTSVSAADKVYDGNTSASLTSTDNRFSGDAVSVTARGQFADKNVGVSKSVAITGLTLSGADASNYSLSAPASTTAAITRLAQVTWVGGTTGSWFDPANWAGGAVPDMANVANVTIPAGVTVSFDNVAVSPAQAGPVNVDSLGTAGSLALSAGSLNVGMGGVTLNALTQTGGALATTGAVVLGSLSQSAGSLSAGSLSTTTAYSQSGTGTIAVTGDVAFAATAAPVVLGNLSTGGALSVSSTGGSITQTAGTVLTVTGPATFTASQGGAAADVTLDNAGNALNGPVTATGADVKLRTTGALTASVTATGNATLTSGGSTTLGATTVGGDLQVTTANANVTQTGPVVVGGTTTLNAGTGSVQLTDAGNRFAGSVSVTAASYAMTGAPDVAAEMDKAPEVLSRVVQASLPYQVTLIQLPQGDASGQVHIEIQNAIGEVQMELPSALKNWIAAAGADVALENGSAAVLDGVDLADNGATLNVRASVDRSIPLEFVIRAGREQVAVRIVWKP